jgi:LmbE family N-acetylglucosaminyl deacetylase
VLCVAAHPDDLDFGSSGTVAGLVQTGVEVTYLLCTRGEQGGFDDTPREEMPALREKEQRAAAAAVGVHDVRFLDGFRDGWLEPNHELVEQIVRVNCFPPTYFGRQRLARGRTRLRRLGPGH